jgi:hypothetical protein
VGVLRRALRLGVPWEAVVTPYEQRKHDERIAEVNALFFPNGDTPASEPSPASTEGDGAQVASWLRWVHRPAIEAGVDGWVVLSSPTANDKWQSKSHRLTELKAATPDATSTTA